MLIMLNHGQKIAFCFNVKHHCLLSSDSVAKDTPQHMFACAGMYTYAIYMYTYTHIYIYIYINEDMHLHMYVHDQHMFFCMCVFPQKKHEFQGVIVD